MIERIRDFVKLARGDYIRTSTIIKSYDGLEEQFVQEEINRLVEDGILVNLFRDYYVVGSFDSDEDKKATSQRIQRFSHKLHKEADTRTEVKITGEMVEDSSFKTEGSPFDI